MRDGRQLIETERTRLQELAKLDERLSETNSRQITEKVKELTQKYVTGEASQYFTREAKKLGLTKQQVVDLVEKGYDHA